LEPGDARGNAAEPSGADPPARMVAVAPGQHHELSGCRRVPRQRAVRTRTRNRSVSAGVPMASEQVVEPRSSPGGLGERLARPLPVRFCAANCGAPGMWLLEGWRAGPGDCFAASTWPPRVRDSGRARLGTDSTSRVAAWTPRRSRRCRAMAGAWPGPRAAGVPGGGHCRRVCAGQVRWLRAAVSAAGKVGVWRRPRRGCTAGRQCGLAVRGAHVCAGAGLGEGLVRLSGEAHSLLRGDSGSPRLPERRPLGLHPPALTVRMVGVIARKGEPSRTASARLGSRR
jgi:hypothetical protein